MIGDWPHHSGAGTSPAAPYRAQSSQSHGWMVTVLFLNFDSASGSHPKILFRIECEWLQCSSIEKSDRTRGSNHLRSAPAA